MVIIILIISVVIILSVVVVYAALSVPKKADHDYEKISSVKKISDECEPVSNQVGD